MPRQREARAPVLRVVGDQPATQLCEALLSPELAVRHRQPVEGQIGALGRPFDDLFPHVDGLRQLVIAGIDVAEVQICRHHAGIQIDGRLKTHDRPGVVAMRQGLQAELVLEKREDALAAPIFSAALMPERAANVVGLLPLMLVFVQLLDVHERVVVVRIQLQHFVERFERPVDEAAALEVQAKAQQHVRLFEPRQLRALQQALMNGDGARHLPLFTVETAEQQVNFERISERVGRLVQLFDGQIELVGDEKIQSENVMERLGRAPLLHGVWWCAGGFGPQAGKQTRTQTRRGRNWCDAIAQQLDYPCKIGWVGSRVFVVSTAYAAASTSLDSLRRLSSLDRASFHAC